MEVIPFGKFTQLPPSQHIRKVMSKLFWIGKVLPTRDANSYFEVHKSSMIRVSESKLMLGYNSLMVMIAWALLWAMTLPDAPQGLINSQQTMLIVLNEQVT
jgi:hypothetical protein